MNLTQITCPYCHSEMIKTIKSYETKYNGTRHLHKCKQCNKVFSETKGSFLEKLVKPISLITKVLQSRHEVIGVNKGQLVLFGCRNVERKIDHYFYL